MTYRRFRMKVWRNCRSWIYESALRYQQRNAWMILDEFPWISLSIQKICLLDIALFCLVGCSFVDGLWLKFVVSCSGQISKKSTNFKETRYFWDASDLNQLELATPFLFDRKTSISVRWPSPLFKLWFSGLLTAASDDRYHPAVPIGRTLQLNTLIPRSAEIRKEPGEPWSWVNDILPIFEYGGTYWKRFLQELDDYMMVIFGWLLKYRVTITFDIIWWKLKECGQEMKRVQKV